MEKSIYETLDYKAHDSASLRFLYENAAGRLVLKLMVRPFLSKLGGAYLKSAFSKRMIPRFIKKNKIDMDIYEGESFRCFNDFFKRKIKAEHRPFSNEKHAVFSPCDGKLSAYTITPDSCFSIKGFRYDVQDLLQDHALARAYMGGVCLIYRLMPDDYHRYCYIADGEIKAYRKIPGVLHTVRPIALSRYNVLGQNTREYALIQTEHMGNIVQMEVGALFVGRISNHKQSGKISRGEEKGMFEFGGSTIVMLFEKDRVQICDEIFKNTRGMKESIVRMGEAVGYAADTQNALK